MSLIVPRWIAIVGVFLAALPSLSVITALSSWDGGVPHGIPITSMTTGTICVIAGSVLFLFGNYFLRRLSAEVSPAYIAIVIFAYLPYVVSGFVSTGGLMFILTFIVLASPLLVGIAGLVTIVCLLTTKPTPQQ